MPKPEPENDSHAADQQGRSDNVLRLLDSEVPEHERCETMQNLWREGLLFHATDNESGVVLLTSFPLLRVFTISNELVASELKRHHGSGRVGKKALKAQAETILNSIENSIQQHHGVFQKKNDGEATEIDELTMQEIGLHQGVCNDGYVVGLFFTSDSREKATHEILSQLGSWGVRTEITDSELRERQEIHEHVREKFDEDEFRPRFESMTHEEQSAEIQLLWTRGIEFEMTDAAAETHYSSVGAKTTFGVDYSLGRKPKDLQMEWTECAAYELTGEELPRNKPLKFDENFEKLMQTVVYIERAILDVIHEKGGEVEVIRRMIEVDENNELSRDMSGDTMIDCRFPTREIRDQVVKDVLDSWEMFDVSVDPNSRQLTLEQKIEEAALLTARMEYDPEREQQLLSKKGPAFDELKDRIINAGISAWESAREGNAN